MYERDFTVMQVLSSLCKISDEPELVNSLLTTMMLYVLPVSMPRVDQPVHHWWSSCTVYVVKGRTLLQTTPGVDGVSPAAVFHAAFVQSAIL